MVNYKKIYFWIKNILAICFWLLILNYWIFKKAFMYKFTYEMIVFLKDYCFYLTLAYLFLIIIYFIKKKNVILNFIFTIISVPMYMIFYPILKIISISIRFMVKLDIYNSALLKNSLHFILFLNRWGSGLELSVFL